MIVFGIDPGIAHTGYGVIKADQAALTAIGFGSIRTDAKAESAYRLKSIYDSLIRLVSQYQPDIFVLEDIFFNKNVSSALAVGEARGIAKLVAANASRKVWNYPPAQVKQAVVGYGKASKHQIQEMVKILLKLDEIPQPDHAADALAIAICHARSRKVLQLRERYNNS